MKNTSCLFEGEILKDDEKKKKKIITWLCKKNYEGNMINDEEKGYWIANNKSEQHIVNKWINYCKK